MTAILYCGTLWVPLPGPSLFSLFIIKLHSLWFKTCPYWLALLPALGFATFYCCPPKAQMRDVTFHCSEGGELAHQYASSFLRCRPGIESHSIPVGVFLQGGITLTYGNGVVQKPQLCSMAQPQHHLCNCNDNDELKYRYKMVKKRQSTRTAHIKNIYLFGIQVIRIISKSVYNSDFLGDLDCFIYRQTPI